MDRSPTLDVSERISVSVSHFKGVLYFHLRDKLKQKSLSLKKDDFMQLCKMREDLLAVGKKIEKREKSSERPKNKSGFERKNRKASWARDWDAAPSSDSGISED